MLRAAVNNKRCFYSLTGNEVFKVEVHPRGEFRLEAVDNSLSDINYFKYEVIDDKNVAIKLAHSLEDLVDRVSAFWPSCQLLSLLIGFSCN